MVQRLTRFQGKSHTQDTIIWLLQERCGDIVGNAEDEVPHDRISRRESYSVSKHRAPGMIIGEYFSERDIGNYTLCGAFLGVVRWLGVMGRDVRSRNPSTTMLVYGLLTDQGLGPQS